MKLDDAIHGVVRAVDRLEDGQGRIARRNARAAVKAAVATVLRAMDREYPLIRKERVVRVSMTPVAKERRARRRRMLWAPVLEPVAAELMARGVTCIKEGEGNARTWVAPYWAHRALKAKMTYAAIEAAAKSPAARRKLDALIRLSGTTP